MGIRRANPFLEEIIEVLNLHLQKYGGDHAKAREYLSKDDNAWIDSEILHCMTERRYFLSNYYAIKTEDRGFTGLYPFWDSQEILHDEFRKLEKRFGKVRAIVNKARQMGGSTYVSGEVFAATIFSEHVNSIVVAQDADVTRYILDMYAAALDFLPWWMRPRIRYQEAGKFIDFDEKDETLRITRPGLKTRIYGDNGNKPTGVGRSKTFSRAHLDELPFWTDPSQLTKALFPTFNAPDGFYVMISTPKGRNNPWHNMWRKAEAGDIDWNPIYIPFYRREKTYSLPIQTGENFELTQNEEDIKSLVFRKDGFVMKNEVFNWRRKRIQEFIANDGDDKMFNQEYSLTAEESFQTSAVTAYPLGIINKLMKRTYNPKWIGEISYDFELGRPHTKMREVTPDEELEYPKHHNRFSVWKRERPGAIYVVGVDVSLGNDGGDFSSIHVIDISLDLPKDEVVAVWHGYIDPESLAEVVLAICWMYNEALAAVEVNSMGMVTNNKLVRQYEYENIYRYKHLDKLTHWMTDVIGFWTNDKTKRALMSKMSKTLIDDLLIIPDKFTVDEFYDFTEEGAEGDGARDDYCFPPEVLVDTTEGMIPISEVKREDAVYSHDGYSNLVEHVASRDVSEELTCLKVFGIDRVTRCTGNHPIYTMKRTGSSPIKLLAPSWIRADQIEKNDFVYVPRRKLPTTTFTEDELYLLGWYLADGYATNSKRIRGGVSFCLSDDDDEMRLLEIMQRICDEHPTKIQVYHAKRVGSSKGWRTSKSTVRVIRYPHHKRVATNNVWLNQWLKQWCGGPNAKFIHPAILNSRGTLPFVAAFLEGDGSQKCARMSISAVQKNHNVLRGIQRILIDHGIWASIHPGRTESNALMLSVCGEWVNKLLSAVPTTRYKPVERLLSHPIARFEGDGFWAQVASVSKEMYSGPVYNMAVEEANTYLVNGIAVHNCMSLHIALYCGHENEYKEMREGVKQESTKSQNEFKILDRFGTIIQTTNSQHEAERVSKKNIGSSIVRESGATAIVNLKGIGKRRVPSDFQNSDWSPIHDGEGAAHHLHYEEGVDAELITPEVIAEYEAEQDEMESDDANSWLYQ